MTVYKMPNKICKIICLVFLFLYIFTDIQLNSHGFSSNTLIQLVDGSLQTIHTICSKRLHKPVVVASYNTHTLSIDASHVKATQQIESQCCLQIGFDCNRENDIICAVTQEFYLPKSDQWIPACKLIVGDELLTSAMTVRPVTYVKFVFDPLQLYMLEIEKLHTFFVGKYSALTHNIALPVGAYVGFSAFFGGGAVVGSFFGPVAFVGGISIGVLHFAIKAIKNCRSSRNEVRADENVIIQENQWVIPRQEDRKSAGCFNPEVRDKEAYIYVSPIENPLSQQLPGCMQMDVAVDPTIVLQSCITPDESKEAHVTKCFEQETPVDIVTCYGQDTVPVKNKEEGRYDGPKARNWKEFERDCPIGQKYGKKFAHTGKQNPKDGCPLRKISEDISNAEMFKKGYFVALDKFHEGDHVEVWDKNGNWIGVANLDGSKNHQKSNAEKNPGKRNIKKIL